MQEPFAAEEETQAHRVLGTCGRVLLLILQMVWRLVCAMLRLIGRLIGFLFSELIYIFNLLIAFALSSIFHSI
ncbi:hypothetical protein BBOMB_1429 [Bifidobacterium bombi DSM 19703]|uniref:Uncharacterized protein n=1 Tax=Bifidobacterium bombi DSM 19703 TaxID=1341695 RepID=A0A086BNQ5_9BIFI|nr:hypothetical protein BBOMB_1429 [Bifidobacterium bombi DSM 19703]